MSPKGSLFDRMRQLGLVALAVLGLLAATAAPVMGTDSTLPEAPAGAAAVDPRGGDPGAATTTAAALPADPIAARIITDPAFRAQFIAAIGQRVRDDPAFADWFRQLVVQRIRTDATFAATWRAALRVGAPGIENAGPTPWTGGPLVHPHGGTFPTLVTRWAELALTVMAEHNIDPYYLPGILAQIQQESSGLPDAVNVWDSNAAAGYASMGLLQVICPTYRAYAKPGFAGACVPTRVPGTSRLQQVSRPWQMVPYTNLWAALNYVMGRYGYSKFMSWNSGSNAGYARLAPGAATAPDPPGSESGGGDSATAAATPGRTAPAPRE